MEGLQILSLILAPFDGFREEKIAQNLL